MGMMSSVECQGPPGKPPKLGLALAVMEMCGKGIAHRWFQQLSILDHFAGEVKSISAGRSLLTARRRFMISWI
jgi:hypothetical protein